MKGIREVKLRGISDEKQAYNIICDDTRIFDYGIKACQCMPNFKFYFPLV